MNVFSAFCGGHADWGFGVMQDQSIPLNLIFRGFAMLAIISIVIVLLIRPNYRFA